MDSRRSDAPFLACPPAASDSFEITSQQAMGVPTRKARLLIERD